MISEKHGIDILPSRREQPRRYAAMCCTTLDDTPEASTRDSNGARDGSCLEASFSPGSNSSCAGRLGTTNPSTTDNELVPSAAWNSPSTGILPGHQKDITAKQGGDETSHAAGCSDKESVLNRIAVPEPADNAHGINRYIQVRFPMKNHFEK